MINPVLINRLLKRCAIETIFKIEILSLSINIFQIYLETDLSNIVILIQNGYFLILHIL